MRPEQNTQNMTWLGMVHLKQNQHTKTSSGHDETWSGQVIESGRGDNVIEKTYENGKGHLLRAFE